MRWIAALLIVLICSIEAKAQQRCYRVGEELRCDNPDGSRTVCYRVGKELRCKQETR